MALTTAHVCMKAYKSHEFILVDAIGVRIRAASDDQATTLAMIDRAQQNRPLHMPFAEVDEYSVRPRQGFTFLT